MKDIRNLTLPNLLYESPEAVKSLQDGLVAETIELCYRGSAYYRKLMDSEGLTPDDIRSTDDLVNLPVTTKQQFLEDPEAFRIRLDDLPTDERTLWEVVYTTGTTSGQPAPVYTTTFDYYAYLFNVERRKPFAEITPADTIANVFPLTRFPMGAYVRADAEAAAYGAAIVKAHTGRPEGPFDVHRSLDEAIGLLEQHRVTIIWGVASFVRRLLIRAQELHADLSSLRMCMITGESSSSRMLENLRSLMIGLGSIEARVLNRYGSTESGNSMMECAPGSGFHNPAPDQVFHEVVDPESGRRLGDGEAGLLAITHLIRRGTVFVRYALGDIVKLTHEPCPYCGRTASERIVSQPRRTKDIVKVKGTLVNTAALQDALQAHPALDEFQFVLAKSDPADPLSADDLVLKVAFRATANEIEMLSEELRDRVTQIANVRPRIVVVSREEIFDPYVSAKAKRFVDARPSAD